jgi:hypothetical protein
MGSDKERNVKSEGEQGQALLEFALVAVFLLIVLFGIMDFSRLFFAYATMSNGAREGARFAITHSHPGEDHEDEIIERAGAMLVLIGGEATIEVEYLDEGTDDCPTGREVLCPVQVRVSSHLDVWTPLIPEVDVLAQATMHIE